MQENPAGCLETPGLRKAFTDGFDNTLDPGPGVETGLRIDMPNSLSHAGNIQAGAKLAKATSVDLKSAITLLPGFSPSSSTDVVGIIEVMVDW